MVDEEREERLERMRIKALELKAMQTCKGIVMELMEDAVLESEWKQESCMNSVSIQMEGMQTDAGGISAGGMLGDIGSDKDCQGTGGWRYDTDGKSRISVERIERG